MEQPGLARAIAGCVQHRVLPRLAPPLPSPALGTQLGVVEATASIEDVVVDSGVQRVHLLVRLAGETLGAVALAPEGGRVLAAAIRAAIADQWAERVLTRFLARRGEGDSLDRALWELDAPVYARIADAVDLLGARLRWHDDGRHRGPARPLVLEAGGRVPPFVFGTRNVAAELHLAGRSVGSAEIVVGPLGVVSGRAVRTALCQAAGPALARAVARELLVGGSLQGGPSLYERSRAIARAGLPLRRATADGRRAD